MPFQQQVWNYSRYQLVELAKKLRKQSSSRSSQSRYKLASNKELIKTALNHIAKSFDLEGMVDEDTISKQEQQIKRLKSELEGLRKQQESAMKVNYLRRNLAFVSKSLDRVVKESRTHTQISDGDLQSQLQQVRRSLEEEKARKAVLFQELSRIKSEAPFKSRSLIRPNKAVFDYLQQLKDKKAKLDEQLQRVSGEQKMFLGLLKEIQRPNY